MRARVREHLLALCPGSGEGSAEVDALLAPKLDDVEVCGRWWSVLPESSEEVHERVAELLRQARSSPHEHIGLVSSTHHG